MTVMSFAPVPAGGGQRPPAATPAGGRPQWMIDRDRAEGTMSANANGGGMTTGQGGFEQGNGMGAGSRPQSRPQAGGPQQAVTGVGLGSYDADNNLMGSTILPQDSRTLMGYNGMVERTAGNVADFQYTPFQSQGPFTSTGTAQYQGVAPVQGRTAGETDSGRAQSYLDRAGAQTGAGAIGSRALMGIAGDGGGGGGGFSYGGPGADVGKARAQTMTALDDAMTGPDRTKLASDSFDLMKEQSQADFDQSQRDVGKRASALGRVGAGMTTNDLTGLAQSRDKNLNFAARDLALQAADKTLADKIARTDLGARTAGGFADSDRGDAGLNLQGAQLGEQSAARVAGNKLSAGNALMGYDISSRDLLRNVGNDTFGMGATNTRERASDADRLTGTDQFNAGLGERKAEFQYGADRDAYDRAVTERDTGRADEFNRDDAGMRRVGTLSGVQENQRSYERGNRDEVRGERDYQTGMEDQSYRRQVEQQQFNEWMRNSGWGRTMGAAGTGFGGDPSGATSAAAGAAQNAANGASGANSQLLSAYMNRPRSGGQRPS